MVTTDFPRLILGAGNYIQQDDGIGIHTINALREMELPSDVEIVDGGISGFDLIPIVDNREKIIIIDAVNGNQAPGTIYRFRPDDVESKHFFMGSLHQLGIIEALKMADLLNKKTEDTIILGVQPEVIDWGMELSDSVRKTIPKLIELIFNELNIKEISNHKEA